MSDEEREVLRNIPSAPTHRDTSTERVRAHRERQRLGLVVIRIDLYGHEISELIRYGFLAPDEGNDKGSIATALMRLLDELFPRLRNGQLRL